MVSFKLHFSIRLFHFIIYIYHFIGSNNEVTNQLLAVIRKYYIPGLVLIHFDPNKPDDLTRPSVKEQFRSIDEQTTVYICHNQVCQVPITTVEELEKNLSTQYIYD